MLRRSSRSNAAVISLPRRGKRFFQEVGNATLGVTQTRKVIPELKENAEIPLKSVSVKEGFTTPPSHFTEDTILHAMETASAKEMPEDCEHHGLGTPATRAAILEKLVANGFVERKEV